MESTGEEEAVMLCSKIDIKEEPVVTDLYWQPVEEIKQLYIKEENVKLEISEDYDVCDPLQIKKEECPSEVDFTSLSDAVHIKQEPELQIEAESTSCGSEPERIIPAGVEDNRNDHLLTETGNAILCTTNKEASSDRKVFRSCTTCEKTFANLNDLKKHKHKESCESLHTCNICHNTFTTDFSWKNHWRMHTGEHPLSCGVCHRTFTVIYSLKAHLRLHTGERPYSCNWCEKTFRTSYAMKLHVRVHTREHPYVCQVCHKTFMYTHTLHSHLRTHFGKRPYTCGVCHKRFTSLIAKKQHSCLHRSIKPCTREVCHPNSGRPYISDVHNKTSNTNSSSSSPIFGLPSRHIIILFTH